MILLLIRISKDCLEFFETNLSTAVNIMNSHHFVNLALLYASSTKSLKSLLQIIRGNKICIIDVKFLEETPKLFICQYLVN